MFVFRFKFPGTDLFNGANLHESLHESHRRHHHENHHRHYCDPKSHRLSVTHSYCLDGYSYPKMKKSVFRYDNCCRLSLMSLKKSFACCFLHLLQNLCGYRCHCHHCLLRHLMNHGVDAGCAQLLNRLHRAYCCYRYCQQQFPILHDVDAGCV